MKPISKIVLIAALALGASFSIAGVKSIGADTTQAVSSRDSASATENLVSVRIQSSERSSTEPAQLNFNPEPNDPPQRTWGAGSR